MTRFVKTKLAVLLTLLLWVLPVYAESKLAQLQIADNASAPLLDVLDTPGLQQPTTASAAFIWRLTAGDAVSTAQRPPERLINLYTGSGGAPVLLCRVAVRYYRSADQWVAHFQINQEPALAKVNGQWQPLQLAQGLPAVIVQHGSALPNAEGYFAKLEFGFSSGTLAVTGWEVR